MESASSDPSPGWQSHPAGTGLRDCEEPPLTPLHPNYVKALRIGLLPLALVLVIAALVLEGTRALIPGAVIVPVALLLVWLLLAMPARRYHARGYDMGADRLRVVRGVLFHRDIVVPFGRVQHLDVEQGPVERWYGLATLTLHTAGTHNASVSLPGLAHGTALEMREAIRAHIRRETM